MIPQPLWLRFELVGTNAAGSMVWARLFPYEPGETQIAHIKAGGICEEVVAQNDAD